MTVIGILAGITLVTYGSWREGLSHDELKSGLNNVATIMKQYRNFNNTYPTTDFPSGLSTSSNVILELTNTGSANSYCVNAYHKETGAMMFTRSESPSEQSGGLCSGNGVKLLGATTLPNPPKGKDIGFGVEGAKLTGTASYNGTTDELTLGSNGTAEFWVRVYGASSVTINGQFYANTQSVNASFQPDGGWHVGTSYYQANRTTAQNNTAGQSGNGCARTVALNAWGGGKNGTCGFTLGNNIAYTKLVFYSSASGWSSSSLKIRKISIILN